MGVSKGEVMLAYRFLLGRPASPQETELWDGVESVSELRRRFVESAEFRNQFMLQSEPSQPAGRVTKLQPMPVEWRTDPATETALLDYVSKTWTKLGEEEPHWSVLSADEWRAANLPAHRTEFYQTGAADAADIAATLERHGATPAQFASMLEYGCGVGRVTPHLARMFGHVTAVDISRSHLELAAQAVAESGVENVDFVLAALPEFGMARPFDLWFSRIVLQHNPPPVIALILRRMFNQLAANGIAIFQVCTFTPHYNFNVARYLAATGEGNIEVHCLPQHVVFELAAQSGCRCIEVTQDGSMPYPWVSNVFVFRKPG